MAKGLWGVIGKSVLGLLGLLVLLFVTGVAFGYMSAHGVMTSDDAVVWIMTIFAVLVMIGSLWVGVAWMRSIDEAAREAHKSAWYWGGTAGMAVGGVGVILSGLDQAEALRFAVSGRTDPAAYMAAGAMLMLLLMLAGYTIVWAWWWLARR
ncbi:hypothetical protein [Brevundimonas sp.]|uniref:hypothetical protein n=1 Tax=Brevundimonas sp. TaxID=1871086 RepID=UPI001A2321D1|nr:hypothetical protein [Brevundimonas sp.]MBJ7486004.1 hypothetical protein [Brevundimonas sp.]